jgi:SAM-dependent methyltransferase
MRYAVPLDRPAEIRGIAVPIRAEKVTMTEPADYVQHNRGYWDAKAASYAQWAPRAWSRTEPIWGQLKIPDAQIGALPATVEGMDTIELGCGTAYFSAWLAKRGARPVGIDNSPGQLATAREMQVEFGIEFPLHLGNAEELPFPDDSFDLAISEYGASIWCDPDRWIPEAAWVLRPGGLLVFLVNGLLAMLGTSPDDTADVPISAELRRPLFGMRRFEWPDEEGVEFHLPHGKWIRVLRDNGFGIEALFELQASEDWPGQTDPVITPEYARQWPAEEIWRARLIPGG